MLDADAISTADVVVSVQPLARDAIRRLRRGAATISFLPVNQELALVADLRDVGATAFAMELVPRISRAQSMDALSSQALVSGYRCAIVAAGMLRRFFPLNMTAAGTVQPAEIVVLGAGVAGLQAIATCKRLGAVVRAYDVRAAAAEEIRSMGAKSIDLELDTLEGAGGYAREMTEDRARLQMERLAPYIANADALITTAAVPGRQAPLLVTSAMVEAMKPGSVVVDLASESGGNVEGSVAGEVTRIGNASVWGGKNVPSQMPGPASRLYAQNVVNILTLMTSKPGAERTKPPMGASSRPTSRTRSWPAPASPTTVRSATSRPARRSRVRPATKESKHERGSRLADDLHPQRLRRHRGHLQGVLDAAHAADVGCQRHPRRDPARRDHRHRQHRQQPGSRGRADRDRAGRGQHGRRLRGHRPDAADVRAQEAGREVFRHSGI